MAKHRDETPKELDDRLGQEMSVRLHHLYGATKNPLYVWEAITKCRNAGGPIIPDWCIPYLRQVALRLTDLASGHDFSKVQRFPPISSDQAMQLVAKALSLSRQSKRNAFAELLINRRDADAARKASRNSLFNEIALKETEKKRSISRDQAQRIIKRGKRLLLSR